NRLNLWESLGRNPEHALLCPQQRSPPRLRQHDKPLLPVWAGVGFGLGEQAEPDQPILQLVGVSGIRPRLLAYARDRRFVQAAPFPPGVRVAATPPRVRA